jgi:hypothetical protein
MTPALAVEAGVAVGDGIVANAPERFPVSGKKMRLFVAPTCFTITLAAEQRTAPPVCTRYVFDPVNPPEIAVE